MGGGGVNFWHFSMREKAFRVISLRLNQFIRWEEGIEDEKENRGQAKS